MKRSADYRILEDRRESLYVRARAWLRIRDAIRDDWGLGGYAPITADEIDEIRSERERHVPLFAGADDQLEILTRAAELRREGLA